MTEYLVKRLSFLFLVLLLITLSGCQQQAETGLRFGLASAPVTLDPRFATDATSARINRLIYESLVDFDENMMPIASLASWQLISPTHYRFTLQPNKKFHDGSSLTSHDVAATYHYILDANNGSSQRTTLTIIERIETPNSDTVDFFLSRPDPLFPGYLVVGILPAEAMSQNHPFNRHALGSGPFRFVDWPENGRLQLRRDQDGQLLEFIRVQDTTVRVLKLVRGEIDMLQNDLSPELVKYLDGQAGVKIQRGRGSNFTYLGFNMEDEVVGLLKVRQAIANAINRPEIIKHVFAGAARPASALLPPDHWAGHKSLSLHQFNPDRARALLAELGYNKENPLKLTYKTSSDPFRIRIATVIQSQLASVGIQMDLRSYDWGTFYADIKAGNFQMYSLSWVGIHTPDIFHYIFHSSSIPPHGANRGRYIDPLVDNMLDKAQQESDLTGQARWYTEVQARIFETLPYVPLWYEDHIFIANDRVSGYAVNVDGNYDGLIAVTKR